MIANPRAAHRVRARPTGGQDPNHRNSGDLTLTLSTGVVVLSALLYVGLELL
jgi:hypothetical protein